MSLFFQGAKPSLIALLAHKILLIVKIQEVVVRCVAPNGACFEYEHYSFLYSDMEVGLV